MKLYLIVLKTNQLKACLEFYQSLGMIWLKEQHGDGPEHYSCQLDGQLIELYPARDTNHTGNSRLGFELPLSIPNYNEVVQFIQSIEAKRFVAGEHRFCSVVTDPDGRKVELVYRDLNETDRNNFIIDIVSVADIERCFPVLQELRPHLNPTTFLTQFTQQQKQGYCLSAAQVNGKIAAVAGYRLTNNLAWGKFLYVDDLVTLPEFRGQGLAGKLLDRLIDRALQERCNAIHLDSGHQRHDAHKLYLKKGFSITSHHFSKVLNVID